MKGGDEAQFYDWKFIEDKRIKSGMKGGMCMV